MKLIGSKQAGLSPSSPCQTAPDFIIELCHGKKDAYLSRKVLDKTLEVSV
jgi:hypothetical protein